jgi:hypothetical protein
VTLYGVLDIVGSLGLVMCRQGVELYEMDGYIPENSV